MRRRTPHQEDGTASLPGASGHAPLFRTTAFGLAFGIVSSALNHVVYLVLSVLVSAVLALVTIGIRSRGVLGI